jgi:hypothetical protein
MGMLEKHSAEMLECLKRASECEFLAEHATELGRQTIPSRCRWALALDR